MHKASQSPDTAKPRRQSRRRRSRANGKPKEPTRDRSATFLTRPLPTPGAMCAAIARRRPLRRRLRSGSNPPPPRIELSAMELPTGHDQNADQIAYWNGPGGQHWADRQQTQDVLLTPVSKILIDRARAVSY